MHMWCVETTPAPARVMTALIEALDALLARPPDGDGVSCLGIALDGFEDAHWFRLRSALLDAQAGGRRGAAALLTPDERARASRFVHAIDAVRHLVGRMLLRGMAARLVDGAQRLPAVWPTNEWGKALPLGGFHFNVTHSGPEVWLAVCARAAVGIDVEQAFPAFDDLCAVLHPSEHADLARVRHLAPELAAACRRLWVRKEAVVKAVGLGLSMPLPGFRVAVDARAHGWLLQPPLEHGAGWTACDLATGSGCAAAVVALAPGLRVNWRGLRLAVREG